MPRPAGSSCSSVQVVSTMVLPRRETRGKRDQRAKSTAVQRASSTGAPQASWAERKAAKKAAQSAKNKRRDRKHAENKQPAPKNTGNHGANKGKTYRTFGLGRLAGTDTAPRREAKNRPFSSTELALFTELEKAKGTAFALATAGRTFPGLIKARARQAATGRATPGKKRKNGPGRQFDVGGAEDAALHQHSRDDPHMSQRDLAKKFDTSQSTVSRQIGTACADPNMRSDRGLRSREAGRIPLSTKKSQKVVWEANLPRIIDMSLTWLEGICEVAVELRSWTDEAKLKWGHGQHKTTGRAPVGHTLNREEEYRMKNATMTLAAGFRHRGPRRGQWD
eukprot:SAG11_NODE_795_length_7131_cov_7.053185_8_plen_335_part_01